MVASPIYNPISLIYSIEIVVLDTLFWILNSKILFASSCLCSTIWKYDVSPYESQKSQTSASLGVKLDLCILFVQTALRSQSYKIWEKEIPAYPYFLISASASIKYQENQYLSLGDLKMWFLQVNLDKPWETSTILGQRIEQTVL